MVHLCPLDLGSLSLCLLLLFLLFLAVRERLELPLVSFLSHDLDSGFLLLLSLQRRLL